MEYRHTWEILESAVDEIEVIARPAYARVGMESWQYGILKSLSHRQLHSKYDGHRHQYSLFHNCILGGLLHECAI